jgi:hypothetical protein
MAWPRVGIYYADDDRRYALKTSRAIRKVRASPAFEGALARLGR